MSHPTARRPSGYWQILENVKREIDEFNLAHGTPGTMPRENHLKKIGCGSLATAIHLYFGGFQKLGVTLGYATSRNPNGMFDDFEVLKSALVMWVDAYGMPGTMPTAQQLRAASRNDLVIAITKHDGPQSVAARCGLEMTYEKKADGFYSEFSTLAAAIYALVDSNDWGAMPTLRQLTLSGNAALIRPIVVHGGFPQVAQTLGLTPNRRSPGSWTHEKIDEAVKEFLLRTQTEGVMPSGLELREAGRFDLSVAISRHGGGMAATAIRLGLDHNPKKPGFWEGEGVIEAALLDFIEEHGTPGMMPTQEALCKAGRNDLAIAISRFGGGWGTISKRLNLQLTEMPKGHWKDFENLKAAILAFNERRGRPGEMPMKHDLDFAEDFSLCKAIDSFGGYPAVAERLGLVAGRISLWPRSRDELIIAHELMLFVDIDLDDRKIESAIRIHDTDIVIRSLKVVIEYDSHYYHKDQEAVDRAKTVAIQKAGWNVIRIREKPLGLLQATDISARKGQFKETCNLILERLQTLGKEPNYGLAAYLGQPSLQNKAKCERYIHRILDARKGKPAGDVSMEVDLT